MSEEKLKSITFEYETYIQKLSGEWAEQWQEWVSSQVTMTQLREGNYGPNRVTPEFHNHWEIKTKQEIRKAKLEDINKNNE